MVQPQSFTIPGPPRLRSIAARSDDLTLTVDNENTATKSALLSEDDEIEPKYDNEKERNSSIGMKTPPSTSILEKTPRLCHTPASEDDSFVADYW